MKMLEKMVLNAIKEHNNESDNGLVEYNHKIRLIKMGPDTVRGAHVDHWHNEYPGEAKGDYTPVRVEDPGLRLAVECSFKPANDYDPDRVKYEVVLYSTGDMAIYFDGIDYAT